MNLQVPVVRKIRENLQAIDYDVTRIELTAHPLPSGRTRVYFIGSRAVNTLLGVKAEIAALAEQLRSLPASRRGLV